MIYEPKRVRSYDNFLPCKFATIFENDCSSWHVAVCANNHKTNCHWVVHNLQQNVSVTNELVKDDIKIMNCCQIKLCYWWPVKNLDRPRKMYKELVIQIEWRQIVISASQIRTKKFQKMLSFFVLIVIFGLTIAE